MKRFIVMLMILITIATVTFTIINKKERKDVSALSAYGAKIVILEEEKDQIISKIMDVVVRWELTIWEDLDMPMEMLPSIEVTRKNFLDGIAGYDPNANKIIINAEWIEVNTKLHPEIFEAYVVYVMAHEMRHAWQVRSNKWNGPKGYVREDGAYGLEKVEIDAGDFAVACMQKYFKEVYDYMKF